MNGFILIFTNHSLIPSSQYNKLPKKLSHPTVLNTKGGGLRGNLVPLKEVVVYIFLHGKIS